MNIIRRPLPIPSKLKKIRIYDNTQIVDAQVCLRLHYLRHTEWLNDENTKIWFDFGAAWHSAMDVIWKLMSEKKLKIQAVCDRAFEAWCIEWEDRGRPGPDDIDEDNMEVMGIRNPMVAHEMIHYYIERRTPLFMNKTFRLISVEEPFAVPLMEDGSILYTGRWDKVIALEGSIRGIEHKTTTAFKWPRNLREEYLKSFVPNNQIDGYIYSGKAKHGKKFRGIYVDIALVHKDIHDKFELLPIERDDGALDAWLWETHYIINEIERNREALQDVRSTDGYMAAFPKKTSSCYRFPHNCQYLPICSAKNNPMGIKKNPPDGWKIEQWQPFDYLQLEKIGLKKKDVIQ